MLPEMYVRPERPPVIPIAKPHEYICKVCGKPGTSRIWNQAVHRECRAERDREVALAHRKYKAGLYVSCVTTDGVAMRGVIPNDLLALTTAETFPLHRVHGPEVQIARSQVQKLTVMSVVGAKRIRKPCSV